MTERIDTSDEAIAVVCMLVSNPQGTLRKDGDGWQRRVNDLIRALRDERNAMREKLDDQSYADLRASGGIVDALDNSPIETTATSVDVTVENGRGR